MGNLWNLMELILDKDTCVLEFAKVKHSIIYSIILVCTTYVLILAAF